MSFYQGEKHSFEYQINGKENGIPLVFFHGMGASSVCVNPVEKVFSNSGVQCISISRPGTGQSVYYDPTDISELTEPLNEIIRSLTNQPIILMGWSAGGLYAMSYAMRFPQQVRRLVLLSSAIPFNNPEAINFLPLKWQLLMFANTHFPFLAKMTFKKLAKKVRREPEKYFRNAIKVLSKPDQSIVTDPVVNENFRLNAMESLGQNGEGTLFDALSIARQKPVPLREISVTTDIWHGHDDGILPVNFSNFLHNNIPRSYLFQVEKEGHFLYIPFMEKILNRALFEI